MSSPEKVVGDQVCLGCQEMSAIKLVAGAEMTKPKDDKEFHRGSFA